MTRQWIRECRVTIDGGGSSTTFSDLRVRFRVEQNNLQRPNALNLTITNPSPETAARIRQEGQKITLEAGYQDGYGLIFQGQMIQKRYGRENPTDTYLSVVAQGGDQAYNFATVSKTLAAGHTARDQVDAALEAMRPFGITAGFISDLGSKQFPRARTLYGMARDVLRTIGQSTGSDWWIDGDKLNVLKAQETLPGGAFVLNSNTGLIGMPVQTHDGILVRCLLNPKIRPGTRIQIDQKSIQEATFSPNYTAEKTNSIFPSIAPDGFYKAIIVDHIGDTRGNPWYTDINCIRADGQGHIPLSYAPNGIVDPDTGVRYQEQPRS